jgi:AraC family transcriptional regulator
VDSSPSLFLHESTAALPAHSAAAGVCADDAPAPRGLGTRALARALDHIERHIGDSLTLTDIAAAACISRFHFARLFRVSTGQSPMEYVLTKRIALAKAQLACGPQKISATAASLGFFDQSHFTRTFRRMTGYSPREFRHLHAPVTRHG